VTRSDVDGAVEPIPDGDAKRRVVEYHVVCRVCGCYAYPGRNPDDAKLQAIVRSGFRRTDLGLLCATCAEGRGAAARLS